jgi:hypothetical protein
VQPVRYFSGADDRSHGVTVAQRLPHRHDVRYNLDSGKYNFLDTKHQLQPAVGYLLVISGTNFYSVFSTCMIYGGSGTSNLI